MKFINMYHLCIQSALPAESDMVSVATTFSFTKNFIIVQAALLRCWR